MINQAIPRICLFGIPRVEIGSVSLEHFPTRRCIQILGRLALAHQKRMSRPQLAEVLWPDEYYEATRQRLRQELTTLRRSLGEFQDVLEVTAESVRLDLSKVELDVDEFDRLIRNARQSMDVELREKNLMRSVQVASSPFMSTATESWIAIERIRLDVARYSALVDLGSLLLDASRADEALSCARDAIEIVPERESAHLLAIQSLCQLGHSEDASTQFQSLRRAILKDRKGRLSAKAERIGEEIFRPEVSLVEIPLGLNFSFPAPSEQIFGRDEVLHTIVEMLDPQRGRNRLASIIGMGGIGKTHLILYACRDLAAIFNQRVAFIDLSNLEDASVIPTAVLRSLGHGYVPTKDPIHHLKNVLGEEPLVLALDNLEQFGVKATPILRRLLDEIPALRILAGSRTPLNIAGEGRLNLEPLSVPAESAEQHEATASPALRLFLSLIDPNQVTHGFRNEDWPIVSNIVRRVEGVPLGLQLAASRMRLLGPAALLTDLNKGSDVLVNRREDAPARHRSMRNAISGSFDRLHPSLRQSIASLSIFRGAWTLDAVRAVCDIEDPEGTMEQLADASLISITHEGIQVRFRMLETIREYSHSLLEDHQSFELRRRLVKWMVERSRLVANEIIDLPIMEEIDRLELDIDNMREALRYSLEEFPDLAFELGANLPFFWLFRTSGFEAQQFYAELFRRYGSYPKSALVLRASYGSSLIAHFLALANSNEMFDRTIEIGLSIGDRSLEIKTNVFRAFKAQNGIKYAECRAWIEEMDRFAADFGTFDSDPFVSRIKGIFAQYQGDPESSIPHFRSAVSWFSARGELFFLTRARLDLAFAAIDLGDADLAEANLAGLLARAFEIRYLTLVPPIHGCIGLVALHRKDYDGALNAFHQSLAGWKDLGASFFEGNQWNVIGRTYFEMGRMSDARIAFAKAGEMWLADGLPAAVAVAVIGLAAVSHSEGDSQRAARLFKAAHHVLNQAGATLIRLHARFAARLEADLHGVLPDNRDGDALSLEEAVRLGAMQVLA